MKTLVLSLPLVLAAGFASAQSSDENLQLPAPNDVTPSASDMGVQASAGGLLTALDVTTTTTTTTTQ
ncbi:hypothetical protein [Mangrovicoccus sp. HB161399]|uniref:hypothetical protein n=1 Tax=Mangrovicoccus sp. HB161399 TaxID=2720392 RepID=UPI0015559041|nr:hypothetical protein [Mangrovicoccus sp. HB161399]